MNWNKYTIKSQEVIQQALQIAERHGQQAIEPLHLLSALLSTDNSVVEYLLPKVGVQLSQLRPRVEDALTQLPKVSGSQPYIADDLTRLLSAAEEIATQMKDSYVAIEHLLLALLRGSDTAAQLLKQQGAAADDMTKAIQELRHGTQVTDPNAEETYNALAKYAIDLVEAARTGKLDPVIGRDEEIRRVLQILSRRTKNNPILIGEPGVGKTAIAEGLAERIVRGDVPENLRSKRIFSLDMGALVAGAKYKGEFEERLKSVVNEVKQSNGQVILFIDEIHTLVGAGRGDGAMDAANILKPALARGEMRSIGATTLDEYQKYFEKDKALERRFQIVTVDEPDEMSSISILRGLKEKYETHHRVRILDDALIAAVRLSQRYITDRFLPDKAIDLMDEAAARLRMQADSLPEDIDELMRRIKQMEIEREAIKRDSESDPRIQKIDAEIALLREQQNELSSKWKSEKDQVNIIQQSKAEIEQLKIEADRAERNGDYGRVAEIRYGRMGELSATIAEAESRLKEIQKDSPLVKEVVTAEDIAEVVSKWTHIPVAKMMQGEREKLLQLEQELHKRVVGQDEAISAIANAVRRSRAALQDSKRPIGSFLFLGSTGVGKTEVARALAEVLFDDENMMTRIDMSEYQEKHSASRLVGAPPGYVGYDEGGQLTEAIRRKPYSIVLFDEIEKAHPDVFNVLLQVLDDGRLTDNKGRTVNFKNTIIIMTSNMGSDIVMHNLSDINPQNADIKIDETRDEVLSLLKRTIRPEFLNRIDETIVFTPLSIQQIDQIVRIQLDRLVHTLAESSITFAYSDRAVEQLAHEGYDPEFGARPVKRVIQRRVLNELSMAILRGDVTETTPITLDYDKGTERFVFNN